MYDLVLLLGGSGTRMGIKEGENKHVLKLGDLTVLERIRLKIKEFEKIVCFENKYVVTNGNSTDIIMKTLGQDYHYFMQESPTGIPDAIAIPKPSNRFLLHLGDQFYEEPLMALADDFYRSNEVARVWLKQSDQARYHNTCFMGENGLCFVEKPDVDSGNICTGMYMLDPIVFRFIAKLPRYRNNENNMADLLTQVKRFGQIGHRMMEGYWFDMGKPEAFEKASQVLGGENG